ncbi:ferritin family protein [Desulfobacula phenolica]|uniref:Rubrerythrin n=1 Tax=Desulfobacula phenolica TaxID=90732 RepID=A0A1H2JEW1_9BACT|nr:ferritin family protein [Desulfobacula phenolica]SDU54933.1 Rubrerythrin [Desulfobacula phenolica]
MIELNQKDIITLLIKQEKLLSRLYTIFYNKLPAHKNFWETLAKEEQLHAKWLEQLYGAGEKNLVHFDEGKITLVSINMVTKGIQDMIQTAKSGEIDDKTALIKTADIERSLIEKKVFSQFNGLTEKAKATMKLLERETKKHLAKIEAYYKQVMS